MTLEETVDAIFNAILSIAKASGSFEVVMQHEPKNKPGEGLTCGIWLDTIDSVPAGSGLAETTGLLVFNARIYTSMLQKPEDLIDPNMTKAAVRLIALYHEDFTLGGLVRNIDLLGATGLRLRSQAGYINQDGRIYRVITITIPVIVNDMWEQVP